MVKIITIFILGMLMALQTACKEVSAPGGSSNVSGEWLIPKNQIFDGGPGKDGIPALGTPSFRTISQVSYVGRDELVVMARTAGEVRIYPHKILDWHEIVNDRSSDGAFSVSYCPLTGSAIGYGGSIIVDGSRQTTTFGVSGLLYNTNLILYDRVTDSYWSQMLMKCVGGQLRGQVPEFVHLAETTFGTARTLYPNARALSNNTGVYGADQYQTYPYGDYRTNDNYLIFPVTNDDTRLPRKDRVLGVIGDSQQRAYPLTLFQNGGRVIQDQLDGIPILVVGDAGRNFMIAFRRSVSGGTAETFTISKATGPAVFEDSQGNVYDIFGRVIDGPDSGRQLQPVRSYIAFWFALGAFYPGISIFAG